MKITRLLGYVVLGNSLLTGCSSGAQSSTEENIGGNAGANATTGGSAAIGGTNSSTITKGGSKSVGGSSSGTAGTTSGGQNVGGTTTGGMSNGGANAGGQNAGGATTGGMSNGGANAGGASKGGSGTGGGGNLDPHGFTIRKPSSRQVPCGSGTQTFEDSDWICTFNHGTTHGFVYIQSTPVSCTQTLSTFPVFSSSVAQISVGGQVQALIQAKYDWGGNHHNDLLSFTYEGNGYSYYHSSFGFGWRSCNNMDCLQVSTGASGTVTEDGCTKDRTLPQVCARIKADGTYADLSKDPFVKCLGDPNL